MTAILTNIGHLLSPKDLVERCADLCIAIMDQQAQRLRAIADVNHEVAPPAG